VFVDTRGIAVTDPHTYASRELLAAADPVTRELSQAPASVSGVDRTDGDTRGAEGEGNRSLRPRRARRLGGVPVFDYLGSSLPLAGTYRAIMGVFFANAETFAIAVPTDSVLAQLAASGVPHEVRDTEHLESLLENLERWGNVSRTQDASLARTIEDLKRKRSLWRITEEGRLAEETARRIEESFGTKGALRSNLLAALETSIGDLAALARKPALDVADGTAADNLLRAVFGQAKELADSASAFIGELDEFLSTPEITSDQFVIARDVIVGYVGGFLSDLRKRAPGIADAIHELASDDAERLIAAAAASNPPPSLTPGVDPVQLEAARIRARWDGLAAWFIGTAAEPPRSRDLANRAAEAIATLLRILARLNEARHRTISRARDFVTLARWFEEAPDDETAHRIWHATFGLAPARHFTQGYEDEDEVRAGTSWWTHRALVVEPHLRSVSRNDGRGRPAALEDTRAAQARIRARVRARASARAASLARFVDAGLQPLSTLPELSDDEFEVVTDSLATALAAKREADGSWLVPSLDGRYFIRIVPPPQGAPLAEVRCPRGVLRGLDYGLELVSTAAPAHAERVS
jgi:uncharacterized protein (TIGR02677 family)